MSLRRAVVVGSVILLVVGVTVARGSGQSNDAWLGSWTINLAKSTYSPGPAPQRSTARFEKQRDGSTKVTLDETEAQGQHLHTETVTKFDGKEVPSTFTDLPTTEKLSVIAKRVDDHTHEVVMKVNDRAIGTGRFVVSRDGKTLTLTLDGTEGQTFHNVVVYDRQ
jgi:hypothetical protein